MRPWFLIALLGLVLAGCGGPYKTVSVSGRITRNGAPVANMAVLFQPIATSDNKEPGPGSTGVTDSDGRYTLTLVGRSTRGAVIGKHKVKITPMAQDADSADDRPKFVKPAPKKQKREPALEFEVPPGGTDAANFELGSP
jgi:hypothetical protein